jgi:hypothetical protein
MKFPLSAWSLALAVLAPVTGWSQISVAVELAPPPLPVYAQPPVPGDGYLWTPGYWVWSASDNDYYWVPGTWVLAPNPGDLWTPGYWGFATGRYFWHAGYWGPTVGYYGGLNYGHGYGGSGYQGGRWDRGHFRYNRAVSNIGHANADLARSAYSARPTGPAPSGHVSYNGGPRGTHARPLAGMQEDAGRGHVGPTAEQLQHEQQALKSAPQRASTNQGRPEVAATPRPSGFAEPGFEHARPPAGERHPTGAAGPAPQAPRDAPREVPREAAREAPREAPRQDPRQDPRQSEHPMAPPPTPVQPTPQARPDRPVDQQPRPEREPQAPGSEHRGPGGGEAPRG